MMRIMISVLLVVISHQAFANEWHCLESVQQTSVDFDGTVTRMTCQAFSNLAESEEKKEKKRCEKGARKNRAKVWAEGKCPVKNLLSICTVTKMGQISLPKPIVTHTYLEQGGNLSRDVQIQVARQQCGQLGLSGADFKVVE